MGANRQFLEIQEIVFEWVNDNKLTDLQLVKFIDCFMFEKTNPGTEISKLVERFLDENGLNDAYLHYVRVQRDNPSFFNANYIDMINDVRNAFLVKAYNHFRVETLHRGTGN